MSATIVCFGDSNTHGYDTKTGERYDERTRWTGLLSSYLGEGYRICEEGLGGRTSVFRDPLTEGMSGFDAIGPVLMTHEPVDLLIVMLGTNDTKERFGATPENIQSGMRRLLRKAQSLPEAFRKGNPRILLVCPPPILPVYRTRIFAGEMGAGCDVKSKALAPLYEELAAELGCSFVDAGSIPGVSMSEQYCGMHMEEQAHRALAMALAKKVEEILL